MPVSTVQRKAKRNKSHKNDHLRLCPNHERSGFCVDPDCKMAHGQAELENRQADYR